MISNKYLADLVYLIVCYNKKPIFLLKYKKTYRFVGLSIILDTIIKKFDRRKPFEGTHRTVVCST